MRDSDKVPDPENLLYGAISIISNILSYFKHAISYDRRLKQYFCTHDPIMFSQKCRGYVNSCSWWYNYL